MTTTTTTAAANSAKPITVKIDNETRTRLEHLAAARHRTTHWVMREAINQYVEREEKRDAFRQDALNAWDEYQKTGLHATGSEVDTWIASWGTENELPAPVCHL
jgi:predicted transcriptional regulator